MLPFSRKTLRLKLFLLFIIIAALSESVRVGYLFMFSPGTKPVQANMADIHIDNDPN